MATLTFIGHSAFHLEGAGKSVLVDPFMTGSSTAAFKPDDFAPQTILLTHAHNDHVGDTVGIAQRTGATVIATFELANFLESKGVANAVGGNHGGTIAFDGGTVKIVPAWHTSSYEDGDQVVAPGVPAGLVVRFAGKVVYFAGDTCLFGDMTLIGDEGLDVAVVPIGDHFTMGPRDAAKAIGLLRPKTAIPCHYDTFPPIKQDPEHFRRHVAELTTAEAVVLAPGQSFQVP